MAGLCETGACDKKINANSGDLSSFRGLANKIKHVQWFVDDSSLPMAAS